MGRLAILLVFLVPGFAALAAPPAYTVSSIVNSASDQPGPLAPYALFTIYGDSLSDVTLSAPPNGIAVPTNLGPNSVRVLLDGSFAGVYYISPHQINFLVPANLTPGRHILTVTRDSIAGPTLTVLLQAASPAFYQLNEHTVVATQPDGQVITSKRPAHPGDVVVLYATGLGALSPAPAPLEVAGKATAIADTQNFLVWVNGVSAGTVLYAGVTPGFGGLYQINFRLPLDCPANPEIRVIASGQISAPGLVLPVARPAADTAPSADRQSATTR